LPDLALSLSNWSLLLLLPPATALVAMLTARLTVLRSLSRMP
jgi:cell division transport system permease protein